MKITTSEAIEAALNRLDIARNKATQYQQALQEQREREKTLRSQVMSLEVTGQAKTPAHTHATRDAQEAKNSAAKYRVLLDTTYSDICSLELVLRELKIKLQVEEREAKREVASRLMKLADRKSSYLKDCVEPLAWALASTAASEQMPVEFYQLNELVTNPVNSITRDVKTRAAAIYTSIASGESHV
jgi:phage shock protein A